MTDGNHGHQVRLKVTEQHRVRRAKTGKMGFGGCFIPLTTILGPKSGGENAPSAPPTLTSVSKTDFLVRGRPLDIRGDGGGLGRSGDKKLFISCGSDAKIFFSHFL